MPNKDNTRPDYPEGYQPATGAIASLVNTRVSTGFAKWGFVIFRGVYDNDAEWEIFISLYKAAVTDELQSFGLEEELGPDLEWTIIEDRAALEGVSKDAVRARFLEWVAGRSVERDGKQADKPWIVEDLPRFKYCFYVDEVCFRTIIARRHWSKMTGERWCLSGPSYIVIINGLHQDEEDENEEDDDGWGYGSAIEGNTNYDVGWAYVEALGYTELYSNLSSGGSDGSIWWGFVYRGCRPEIQPEPASNNCQSLSAVPHGASYGKRIQQ